MIKSKLLQQSGADNLKIGSVTYTSRLIVGTGKYSSEKIAKKGLYEKDMLKWVSMDKLKSFKSEVRPWYKKIVNLIIKYGI